MIIQKYGEKKKGDAKHQIKLEKLKRKLALVQKKLEIDFIIKQLKNNKQQNKTKSSMIFKMKLSFIRNIHLNLKLMMYQGYQQ